MGALGFGEGGRSATGRRDAGARPTLRTGRDWQPSGEFSALRQDPSRSAATAAHKWFQQHRMSDTLDNWRKRRASPAARLAINLPVGPKHVWWLLCCTFVLSLLHADVDAHAASGSRHTRQRALQTGPPAPTDASCEVAWDMSAHSNCAPGGACAPCEPCFTNANQGSYAGTCGCFETARGGPQCVEGYAECPPCGQSCLHCVTTAAQSRKQKRVN